MVQRLASGGTLNSPWGIARAPGDFGEFSNDLLIGNFGDDVAGEGSISAFDLTTSSFVGQLKNPDGTPLTVDGLWALQFGGGNNRSGDAYHLYFTAGIDHEDHGLFGFIAAAPAIPGTVPEPASAVLLLSALAVFGLARRHLRHA
jgi:uncharacterized protein (TIGR03118 family)